MLSLHQRSVGGHAAAQPQEANGAGSTRTVGELDSSDVRFFTSTRPPPLLNGVGQGREGVVMDMRRPLLSGHFALPPRDHL